MYGPGYVACSRPESNIGGFISRPPSAASLAPDRHRAPESCVRRPDLLSVSWPKRPPEFGEWPGLRGPQPARVEYRRFYLPPAISSFSGTVRCAIGLGTGILCTPTAICRAFPGRSNHRNLVSGPVYVARSRPESNIGGFISHPPSAASLAPDRNRAPEFCVRRPEFAERFLAEATTGVWCAARFTWPAAGPNRISTQTHR
ncbi:hypothetical protein D3C85_466450 [compost metagenome]